MNISSDNFKLIYITDDPQEAEIAASCGVDRIMIDLETLGKNERQAGLNTWITNHDPRSISIIAKKISKYPNTELIVRVNPINIFTYKEVEYALSGGAHCLMLPMFKSSKDVTFFLRITKERAKVIFLLETKEAYYSLRDILAIKGVGEIHIGLNDLHLSFQLKHMFQLFCNGVVEHIASLCNKKGVSFGIGGVAPLSIKCPIPPYKILLFHRLLNSRGVILSRAWKRLISSKSEFQKELFQLRKVLSEPLIEDIAQVKWDICRRILIS